MKSKAFFSSAFLGFLGLLVFTVMPVSSQTQQKIIEWGLSPIATNDEFAANPKLPLSRKIHDIEIEDLAVNGKSILVAEPFDAADDWLNGITFRVKNISSQPIGSVQVTIVLPQMKNHGPDIVYCYGCAPAERVVGVMPGKVVELKMLGGEFYDAVKTRIAESANLSNINKAEIRTIFITPVAGQSWSGGCVKTTNPRNACSRYAP
jgi:hypothetical protein